MTQTGTTGSSMFSSSGIVLKTGILERCIEPACESPGAIIGFCRLHYIKNWGKIKQKQQILADGRLLRFIEELALKYSDKIIEAIRGDLSSAPQFSRIIEDLDLEEESVSLFSQDDSEEESSDNLIETFRKDSDEPEDAYV